MIAISAVVSATVKSVPTSFDTAIPDMAPP